MIVSVINLNNLFLLCSIYSEYLRDISLIAYEAQIDHTKMTSFYDFQVVPHVDLYFIHGSLANVEDGKEEINIQLLNQTNIDEEYKKKYIQVRVTLIVILMT